jgi:quinoprotein glucose dehydrogenase
MKIFSFLIILIFFSTNGYSQNYSFKKITKLEEPWGSSFISNDEIIVTEKDGKIKIVNINSKNTFEVKHNLNFLNVGQGGLLDIIYQDDIIFGFHILKTEVMVKQVLQLLKQY